MAWLTIRYSSLSRDIMFWSLPKDWGGWLRSSRVGLMANQNARALRKRMTSQEIKLWLQLRLLREKGFHFRRQSPRDGFILDFVCLRAKLIIEVDGETHSASIQSEADRARDAHFRSRGFRTLRFWNCDVDQNLDGVVETVYRNLIQEDPTPTLP